MTKKKRIIVFCDKELEHSIKTLYAKVYAQDFNVSFQDFLRAAVIIGGQSMLNGR